MPPEDPIDLLARRLRELAATLRQIDAERDERRAAAIAASGLPAALADEMLRMGSEESALTSPDQYDQSGVMLQVNSTNFQQPVGKPLKSKGPIAKIAKRLGLTMTELAAKVGADHWNLRNWNKRKSVPVEIQKRLDALVEAADRAGKRAR